MRSRTTVSIALLVALVAGACTSNESGRGGSNGSVPNGPMAVEVLESAPATSVAGATGPTVIELPATRLEFAVGALPSSATVEAAEVSVAGTEQVSGFVAAGNGVKVDISGGTLSAPATVRFKVGQQPDGTTAVTMHIKDDGAWEVQPALYYGGYIVQQTADFSIQLPGWLNPSSWFAGLSHLLGLRTDPPNCEPTPEWVGPALTSSVIIHTCMSKSPTPELVIRSNRPYWMQVFVPQPNKWVWVSGLPEWANGVVNRNFFDGDGSRYLLPPGETMTIGFDQPVGANRQVNVSIERNNLTILLSSLDTFVAPAERLASLYSAMKCARGGLAALLGVDSPTKVALNCLVDHMSELADEDEAGKAAQRVFGLAGGADPQSAAQIASVAKALRGIGKFVGVVEAALQVVKGLDGLADEIVNSAASRADQIDVELKAAASAQPPASGTVGTTPTRPGGSLGVTLTENPFLCDGGLRGFGRVEGAVPGEAVRFYSPQVGSLQGGTADGNGRLSIRWQCDPWEAGSSWTVQVTTDSGRTATFVVTGAAPAPVTAAPVVTPAPSAGATITVNGCNTYGQSCRDNPVFNRVPAFDGDNPPKVELLANGAVVTATCWAIGTTTWNYAAKHNPPDYGPQPYESNVYFMVRTAAGNVGYLPDTWGPRDKWGKLGLPAC